MDQLSTYISSVMNSSDSIKLSSSVTVGHYLELVSANNRKALGAFIIERFDERYFWPVQNSASKHGFASLAIACLVIETLESFYQGCGDTKGKSGQMFRDFFQRNTELRVFADANNWFFRDIRCGILHQAESRDGWRVLRRGPLLDLSAKTINATLILSALQRSVREYARELETDEVLWQNFLRKMVSVCENCK